MLKPVGTVFKEYYKTFNMNAPLETERDIVVTLEVVEHKMVFWQMVQIVTEIDREVT